MHSYTAAFSNQFICIIYTRRDSDYIRFVRKLKFHIVPMFVIFNMYIALHMKCGSILYGFSLFFVFVLVCMFSCERIVLFSSFETHLVKLLNYTLSMTVGR
jgi:hypothetical protein